MTNQTTSRTPPKITLERASDQLDRWSDGPRTLTRFSAARRFSASRINARAISPRFVPYNFDGSKSIIISMTSSGSEIVNDVVPAALGIVVTLL